MYWKGMGAFIFGPDAGHSGMTEKTDNWLGIYGLRITHYRNNFACRAMEIYIFFFEKCLTNILQPPFHIADLQ